MVTLNLKLYAAPLALLMISGALAAPTANADPRIATRTFEVKFSYNPAASAADIYVDLKSTADRACLSVGPRPLTLRKLDQACAEDLLQAALQRIARTDVAEVHSKVQRG